MQRGIKMIVYGVPGVGKTTFAAQAPNPFIIDLERGAERYDVPHNSDISTFMEFKTVLDNLPPCETLIIDTFDELEKLLVQHTMNKEGVDSLNKVGGGYGRGWLQVYEQFGFVISELDKIRITKGVNIILIGHSTIRHFEPADSTGYDRYTFACYEKNNDMLRRWSDITLFARFDSMVVENGQNAKVKSNGKRVMYTVTNPCWEAKSRWKLPEKIPFEFAQVASIFVKQPEKAVTATEAPKPDTEPKQVATAPEKAQEAPKSAAAEIASNIRKLCNVSHLDEETLLAYIVKRGVVPAGAKLDNMAEPVLRRIENGFDAIYKNIKNGY